METKLQVDHQSFDAAGIPNGQPGVIVRALLTVSGVAPTTTRAPIGLAFAIDRSGSMNGDRLEAAKRATAQAVERLHPDDVVSAITFDDQVDTVAAPERRSRHQQLVAQLLALQTGGSTNLSGGWLRAREHMQQALGLIGDLAGSSRRIVLLTDGHANQGITDPATLIELARTARQLGISTTTIGIGEGYDDALLRAMADAGGGNAWYIERPDQSQDVFAQELGALLSVCAQNLRVTVTLGDAVRVATVHSDWPVLSSDDTQRTFDLGDLYAAEPKPVLLELFVPEARVGELASLNTAVATITVRADVITAQGGVEQRILHLPIAATLDQQQRIEPAIEEAVLLARAAKAREDAARRQREGDADGAAQIMAQAAEQLSLSALHADLHTLQEASADLGMLERKYRERTHSEQDAKYQMQRSYNAKRGKRSYDGTISRGSQEP